jgi:hypothetical protein
MPTAPDITSLTNLIIFVKDLVGDASSEGCDCAQEISERQIIAALTATKERVGEALEQIYLSIPGAPRGLEWSSRERFFDDSTTIVDGSGTLIPVDEIASVDPLNADWTLNTPRSNVYVSGNRYDPFQAAADLLRQLRIRQRAMVDTSEMGVSLKLSQSLAVMESVEASYRRAARIRSISFGRSDIA